MFARRLYGHYCRLDILTSQTPGKSFFGFYQCSHDTASFIADKVSSGMWYFADQSVGTEFGKFPADLPADLFVGSFLVIQFSPDFSLCKSTYQIFSI